MICGVSVCDVVLTVSRPSSALELGLFYWVLELSMKTIKEVYGISESCLGRVDFDVEYITQNPHCKFCYVTNWSY